MALILKNVKNFTQPTARTEGSLDFGLIILDKPSGPTSHDTVSILKNMIGSSKAGHSGTLDPKVTGVLPVALGRATRYLSYLLKSPKEYVCLMRLHKSVSEEDLERCFKKFTGVINQRVPRRANVKRQERERKIYELELLDRVDNFVLFRALTQAGTYVRKLVHDMGESLKVGAHMLELRRTRVAHLSEVECVDLYKVLQGVSDGDYSFILPGDRIVEGLPKVFVLDSAVDSLLHGASLKMPGVAAFEDSIFEGCDVAVYSLKGDLILTGVSQWGADKVKKMVEGVFVKPSRVMPLE